MKISLAMDPETHRVTAQSEPYTRADFPPGPRGDDWPQRTAEVPQGTWTKMLRATVSPDVQDAQHRRWWTDADPQGEPWQPSPSPSQTP